MAQDGAAGPGAERSKAPTPQIGGAGRSESARVRQARAQARTAGQPEAAR